MKDTVVTTTSIMTEIGSSKNPKVNLKLIGELQPAVLKAMIFSNASDPAAVKK